MAETVGSPILSKDHLPQHGVSTDAFENDFSSFRLKLEYTSQICGVGKRYMNA